MRSLRKLGLGVAVPSGYRDAPISGRGCPAPVSPGRRPFRRRGRASRNFAGRLRTHRRSCSLICSRFRAITGDWPQSLCLGSTHGSVCRALSTLECARCRHLCEGTRREEPAFRFLRLQPPLEEPTPDPGQLDGAHHTRSAAHAMRKGTPSPAPRRAATKYSHTNFSSPIRSSAFKH